MTEDFSRQRLQYERSQIELIQSLPIFENVPSHEQALTYCQSMASRRRRRISCSLSNKDLSTLKIWFESKGSSILVGQAHGVKSSSRDFAIDLLNLVMPTSLPVVWLLPGSMDIATVPTLEDILASLVIQTLEANPAVLSSGINPIFTRYFRSPIQTDKWLQILKRSMMGMRHLLIIVDLTMLSTSLKQSNTFEAGEFLEALQQLGGTQGPAIKVVALTWKLDTVLSSDMDDNLAIKTITTDPGPRKVRLMRNPKFRAAFGARRQKLAVAFRESHLMGD